MRRASVSNGDNYTQVTYVHFMEDQYQIYRKCQHLASRLVVIPDYCSAGLVGLLGSGVMYEAQKKCRIYTDERENEN